MSQYNIIAEKSGVYIEHEIKQINPESRRWRLTIAQMKYLSKPVVSFKIQQLQGVIDELKKDEKLLSEKLATEEVMKTTFSSFVRLSRAENE